MKIKNNHIDIKIFAPFFVIFAVIFVAATVGIFISQNKDIQEESNKLIKLSEDRFKQLEKRDSLALSSVMKPILANNEIKDLFLSRDKDSLYNYNLDTFNNIKKTYGITHWYFIDTNGEVFLRMHNKDLYGDTVERATFLRAKDTQSNTSGIELGKTAFALRVVEPYFYNGELLGYMELSQEIDHFINELSNDTSASYAIIVEKNSINKEDYLNYVENTGIDNNWENNNNYIMISSTIDKATNQYKAISKYLDKDYFLHPQSDNYIFGNVRVGDETFTVGEFHIEGTSGAIVGSVFTALNISKQIKDNNFSVIFVSFILLTLMFLSYLIYSRLVRRNIIDPLKKITDDAEKSFLNNFDSYIDAQSNDEIGYLATQINSLFSEIKKSRLEVDRKVSEQTKSIEFQTKSLEDQQSAILNILEDVEEEKENVKYIANDLKKFKLAVENASDHIVITDTDGIIIYANKAVEKITGYKNSETNGIKAGSKSLWGGLMNSDFYKELWYTIKIKKKVFLGEVRNKRKNGEQYDASINIAPVFNLEGEVLFFVGIERDITHDKEIDRAKTEFVSLASHQLRTPLSSINWYSEMLLDGDVGKLTEDQKQYIGEIYKGNQRMVGLVNALLNVSRLELGTFSVETDMISIREIIDSLILEMAGMAKDRMIKVSKKIDKNIPRLYRADKNLFRIIVQNFLSNAIKYTNEGGKVLVGVNKDTKNIKIYVKDNGYGIPENQKAKIFTKLFRADNVRQMDTEGTGLGLYIIKQIVEACGGKVWFTSKENKGSTFFVTLPLSGMKEKKGSKTID
jgi:PAS domain S-box-containing protein